MIHNLLVYTTFVGLELCLVVVAPHVGVVVWGQRLTPAQTGIYAVGGGLLGVRGGEAVIVGGVRGDGGRRSVVGGGGSGGVGGRRGGGAGPALLWVSRCHHRLGNWELV